jgi:hypothetical protein
MDIYFTVINILGSLLGIIGLAVFGVAAAWLLLAAFQRQEAWQYQLGVWLGFFGFMGILAWQLTPGLLGAFAAGCGIGILIWGMRKPKEEQEPKE